jgi:uncharacterized protein (TIGR02118 family)
MVIVSVMYAEGEGRFDMAYYLTSHMPKVQARWQPLGLEHWEVIEGTEGPDGKAAPYRVIANLRFGSREQVGEAVKAHGKELFGDVPNFTDLRPVVQVSEVRQAEG